MKPFKLIIISLLISGFITPCTSSAEDYNPNDYRELVDVVYEWSPYGDRIQVGDFNISAIRSIWLDDGEKLVEVSTSYIQLGGLARAVLIKKDESGFWVADKIIVFSGEGLAAAMNEVPLIKRKQLLRN